MGNLKKKRRLKMNKHKRRKRLKSNRHKKRIRGRNKPRAGPALPALKPAAATAAGFLCGRIVLNIYRTRVQVSPGLRLRVRG